MPNENAHEKRLESQRFSGSIALVVLTGLSLPTIGLLIAIWLFVDVLTYCPKALFPGEVC